MTDREKLTELIGECKWWCISEDIADHLIANGVVVREKGEWDDSGRYKFANGGKAIRCPICGACLNEEEYDLYVWNFCPICGADMTGGDWRV